MDTDTAVVTDRRGNFCTFSSASTPEGDLNFCLAAVRDLKCRAHVVSV